MKPNNHFRRSILFRHEEIDSVFRKCRSLFLSVILLSAALICLLPASPARAQQTGELSAFPLLRMEASARAAALSGAFSATYDGDASTLFYHPALPGPPAHNALSVSYLNHLGDINAGFLAYSRRVGPLGLLNSGLRFMSYGSFEGRDENGNETDDFSAADVALTLGLSRALTPRLRYGANLHLVYGSLAQASATAVAADFGALYHLPDQGLTISASVNNLGTAVDAFYRDGVTLPVDLRLGLSKRLAYLPLTLSATGYNLHDLGQGPDGGTALDRVMRHLVIGGELRPVDALALRLGYGHRRHEELAASDRRIDPAGLSAGFGLTVRGFTVDYAFSSWSTLGGLHYLTLRTML